MKKITKVAKFGGSSLSDFNQLRKVLKIIQNDPLIMAVVVSAFGKRSSQDEKVTDLLIQISDLINNNQEWNHIWEKIRIRHTETMQKLGLSESLHKLLEEVKEAIMENSHYDFIVSRGEYLSARIMTAYLNLLGTEAYFLDAKDCVVFSGSRLNYEKTCRLIKAKTPKTGIVIIPGFYGSDTSGRIHAFSRGGSDLTGALVACGLRVSVYENWTDVDGVLTADPKFVTGATPIRCMSYKDAHILTSFGASVLHEETVPYLIKYGITLHIRNTNDPEAFGTKVLPKFKNIGGAVGVACQREVTVFSVSKIIPLSAVGYGEKLFHIFALNQIPYVFELPGSDEFSLIVADLYLHNSPNASKSEKNKKLNERLIDLKYEINDQIHPDSIEILKNLSVFTVVGSELTTLSIALNVLISNNIPCPVQHRGPSGQTIIAVPNEYAHTAYQLIHSALFFKTPATSNAIFAEEGCHHI